MNSFTGKPIQESPLGGGTQARTTVLRGALLVGGSELLASMHLSRNGAPFMKIHIYPTFPSVLCVSLFAWHDVAML